MRAFIDALPNPRLEKPFDRRRVLDTIRGLGHPAPADRTPQASISDLYTVS
jgi:hypothetical protein